MKIKLIAVLALILFASGCSVKMAYNNLDRFVRWGVNDFVDLDKEQRAYLDREVKKVWLWHRRTHLPLYANYLETFADRASDEVSPELLQEMFDRFFAWGMQVQERSMPTAIHILKNLTDEQVAGLPEKLAESNADLLEPEQEGELADFQQHWADEVIDGLQQFAGRLQARQKDYVARQSRLYQPERALWVEYRQRWQAELMQELARRQEDAFAERFTRLVKERESYYSEEFAEISAANEALGVEVASHVLSNLNDKQSQRFRNRLLELSEDFRELSEQERS